MSGRPVLVVEDMAHFAYGHYPHSCISLTRALAALGCDVRLLTARGWVGGDGEPGGFQVERFGRGTRALWTVGDRLQPPMSRTHWPRRVRYSAYAAATLRAAAIAFATRTAVRRRPTSAPAPDVIQFGHDVHTFVMTGLVGPGRFVHHAFRRPPGDRPRTTAGRLVDGWARRNEARRRRAGGGLRVAAASPELVDAWTRRAPYLDPVLLAHGMSRDEQIVDDARVQLGIADDARVALVFGADHGNKDLATVWRAFLELPEWKLLVVGHVADAFRTWAAVHDAPDAIVIDGYVDDHTRARAYSAADVVVLSFDSGHVRDSGVFHDALAFRRPVVCSTGCDTANRIEAFDVGSVFAAGDASALAAAVRGAPRELAADAVERALGSTSDLAVARAHLDALDALGAGAGDPASAQTGRK